MGVPILLSEWMLLCSKDRGSYKSNSNYICRTLMATWSKYRISMVTIQSIVSSCIYHPGFKMAARCSNFMNWRECQVDKFYILCPKGKLLSKQQIQR